MEGACEANVPQMAQGCHKAQQMRERLDAMNLHRESLLAPSDMEAIFAAIRLSTAAFSINKDEVLKIFKKDNQWPEEGLYPYSGDWAQMVADAGPALAAAVVADAEAAPAAAVVADAEAAPAAAVVADAEPAPAAEIADAEPAPTADT